MQIYWPPAPAKDAKLPPGTVLFWLGDRAAAAVAKTEGPEQPKYPVGEAVQELDPVTKLPVPFTVGKDGVAAPGPAIMPRPKDGDGAKKSPDK
jgi:hypothetical protein